MVEPPGTSVTRYISILFVQHYRGDIELSGRFCGSILLILPCTNPYELALPLLCGEVIHFIVEKKTGVLSDDARSEKRIDCVGDGYRIAFVINNREMSGVLSF